MERIEFSTSEISASLEELIDAGGHFTICVSGSSMAPFLVHGRDSVRLTECRPQDMKKGRILLFKRTSGELILHRVKRVMPNGSLIMNGDAQFWCEQISPAQVIAAVSTVERGGKAIPCSSPGYRAMVFFWQILFPLRPLIFRVVNKLKRMKNK